ncbi:MAG: hypothetical protein KDB23_25560, partial [Planctomycetales bacterium]|nr:hypothetical protein [Planctomycetales bacterium]
MPELVADLMQRDLTGSQPHLYTQLGDAVYFIAETGATGSELWRTDGTHDGTQLVRTIAPADAGRSDELISFGDTLYFNGYDADAGWELWTSDGTAGGTQRFIDIAPGSYGSSPHALTEVNGHIYFGTRNNDQSQTELWQTDGTIAGTTQISAWPHALGIGTILTANEKAFVRLNYQDQFWVTNGTPEGTTTWNHKLLPYQIYHDTSVAALNDHIFFIDSQGILKRSDGTDEGTTTFFFGEWPQRIASIGNTLYFGLNSGLLASDGTPEGTRRIIDAPGSYYFLGGDEDLALINSATETWRSDGTAEGTFAIGSSEFYDSSAHKQLNAVRVRNQYYYHRYTSDVVTLAVTDGTAAGTHNVDAYPYRLNARLMGRVGDRLLFTSYDEQDGQEPWITDGTETGTHLLRELSPGNSGSNPGGLFSWNDQLFVYGQTMGAIQRLVGGDGSFALPYETFFGDEILATSEAVYFVGRDGLWRIDGTQDGTYKLREMYWSSELVSHGNEIYFRAHDGDLYSSGPTGVELWRSDGTAEGTVLLRDIVPGNGGSNPRDLTFVGDTLYFIADSQLWKSDGTTAGTVLVKGGFAGTSRTWPGALTAVGNTLYFVHFDYGGVTSRFDLWRSDGTEAGTEFVAELLPSDDAFSLLRFIAVGDRMYYLASSGENGELWTTDGTSDGTLPLARIAFLKGSLPATVPVGDKLYFVGADETNGAELWVTDGTVAGTQLVADINPGSASSEPHNFANIRGTLYFSANDGVSGDELWTSDGTAAGTNQVADIYAGPESSDPNHVTVIGNKLYFSAVTPLIGREIWSIDLTEPTDDRNQDGNVDVQDLDLLCAAVI